MSEQSSVSVEEHVRLALRAVASVPVAARELPVVVAHRRGALRGRPPRRTRAPSFVFALTGVGVVAAAVALFFTYGPTSGTYNNATAPHAALSTTTPAAGPGTEPGTCAPSSGAELLQVQASGRVQVRRGSFLVVELGQAYGEIPNESGNSPPFPYGPASVVSHGGQIRATRLCTPIGPTSLPVRWDVWQAVGAGSVTITEPLNPAWFTARKPCTEHSQYPQLHCAAVGPIVVEVQVISAAG